MDGRDRRFRVNFRAFRSGGQMRKAVMTAWLGIVLITAASWMSAQDKPKSEDPSTEARTIETTPLKVSVTFTEFEGEKKVKSLPYTMVVVADARPPKSVLKMGSRVP